MRFEVIELKDGRTGIYNNETGHTMISTDNLSKNDLDKGAEILNYLCNKFDENDKRYNGENILARLKTKIWIFLLFFYYKFGLFVWLRTIYEIETFIYYESQYSNRWS